MADWAEIPARLHPCLSVSWGVKDLIDKPVMLCEEKYHRLLRQSRNDGETDQTVIMRTWHRLMHDSVRGFSKDIISGFYQGQKQ